MSYTDKSQPGIAHGVCRVPQSPSGRLFTRAAIFGGYIGTLFGDDLAPYAGPLVPRGHLAGGAGIDYTGTTLDHLTVHSAKRQEDHS